MGRNRPDVTGTLFKEADVDKDGSVAANELKETFVRWLGEWDGNKDASLGEEELQKRINGTAAGAGISGRRAIPRAGRRRRRGWSANAGDAWTGSQYAASRRCKTRPTSGSER